MLHQHSNFATTKQMHVTKNIILVGPNPFWVIQNNSLLLECINKIDKRKMQNNLHLKIKIINCLICYIKLQTYFVDLGCTSWSSKKRGHHFIFTKSLLQKAIKFLLHNCFFSIGNAIMMQVFGIPMGSDTAPFFANLLLAQKVADWVNGQNKLGTINIRKINHSFQFIHGLLSLHDLLPLENTVMIFIQQNQHLRKKKNNFCASFLDLYIHIENGEFHTRLFDKQDNFGFNVVSMPFCCSISQAKCSSTGALEYWRFLEFLEQIVKWKIFLVIVNSC